VADNDLQEIALTQETVARAATLSNTRSIYKIMTNVKPSTQIG